MALDLKPTMNPAPLIRGGQMAYKWLDTTARTIRLFIIFNDPLDAPVRGSLQHVSLNLRPSYQALSYVWGSNSRDQTIWCDNRSVKVTTSLYEALKEIRRILELNGEQYRTIWADGLCINQDDLNERKQQVKIMDQIYREAKLVHVWLGEQSSDSTTAFVFAAELANLLQSFASKGMMIQIHENYGRHGIRPKEYEGWYALNRLLKRPWFYRMWVIQEVAMANEIMVHCGPSSVEWACFDMICRYGAGRGLILDRDDSDSSGPDASHGVGLMYHIRRSIQNDKKLNLLNLLRATGVFKSGDPKDKVFALLGLAKDAGCFYQHVEYDEERSNTFAARRFIMVAKSVVDNEDIIELLSQVQHPKKLKLPSWVPDWSSGVSRTGRMWPYFTVPEFRAAGNTKSGAWYSTLDTTDLNISGCIIDEIASVARQINKEVPKSEEDGLRIYQPWDEECRRMTGHLTRYPTGESPIEAHWRTRIGNQSRASATADASYGSSYDAWREYMRLLSNALRGQYVDMGLLQRLDQQSDDFATAQRQNICGRRFAITKKGYFAMVPESSEVSYKICIFAGGTVPFILRQEQYGDYSLVGECYVHGLMEGEALRLPGFAFKDLCLI